MIALLTVLQLINTVLPLATGVVITIIILRVVRKKNLTPEPLRKFQGRVQNSALILAFGGLYSSVLALATLLGISEETVGWTIAFNLRNTFLFTGLFLLFAAFLEE